MKVFIIALLIASSLAIKPSSMKSLAEAAKATQTEKGLRTERQQFNNVAKNRNNNFKNHFKNALKKDGALGSKRKAKKNQGPVTYETTQVHVQHYGKHTVNGHGKEHVHTHGRIDHKVTDRHGNTKEGSKELGTQGHESRKIGNGYNDKTRASGQRFGNNFKNRAQRNIRNTLNRNFNK